MKDYRSSLNLSLLIPVAMGTMITSVGCSQEGSIARKYCKNWADCDDDSFEEYYDSVGECTKALKLQLKADHYELKISEAGPECLRATKKVEKCISKLIDCDYWDERADWLEDAADECEDDYEDQQDACEDNYDNGDDYYFYYY